MTRTITVAMSGHDRNGTAVPSEYRDFCRGELRHYLAAVFGMDIAAAGDGYDPDLTLRLECPSSQESGMPPLDRIRIRLSEGTGEVSANSRVALLIGLYRLFFEFGVRYLRPGRANEFLPSLEPDDWAGRRIDIDETASFQHRGVCIEGADSVEIITDFVDWLPKAGFNSFFIQFENPYPFLKRWYEHEFNPYKESVPLDTDDAQEMSDEVDRRIGLRGIVHHRVGHGWTGEVLGYSSKYGWQSGLTLPEERKQLAALRDGRRELVEGAPIMTSLDFANPQAVEDLVRLVVDYARSRPDVDYLHVWLSDARNNICECDACRTTTPSDQYVEFLNRLDLALTRAGLDTRICFLLYHELLYAPKTARIAHPERFTMMFAPITRTFERSYADVDYEHGIRRPEPYVRNHMAMPNSLEENLAFLFDWQRTFAGDSFVYDYPLGRAHYGDLGYMAIARTISRDIPFLDRLGLDGYISCQELRASFPHNLPNYVMGRLLWNKKLRYDDLVEEYFSAAYGDGWREAAGYLDTLSRCSSCDYFNAIGPRVDPVLASRYRTAQHVADGFLETVEHGCSHGDDLRRRQWRLLGLHRRYVSGMAGALRLFADGRNAEAQRRWRDVLDLIRANETETETEFDVYRIIEVAKNYAGFRL